LAAENLFLRKQLARFHERKVKPHRTNDSTLLVMVILGRMFAWRDALANVKPDGSSGTAKEIPSALALEITVRRQTPPAPGPAQTHS
jgi:hypothetical protein